jgi:hypothetical protein
VGGGWKCGNPAGFNPVLKFWLYKEILIPDAMGWDSQAEMVALNPVAALPQAGCHLSCSK